MLDLRIQSQLFSQDVHDCFQRGFVHSVDNGFALSLGDQDPYLCQRFKMIRHRVLAHVESTSDLASW